MSVSGFFIAGVVFVVSALVLPIVVTLLTEETRAWLPHVTRALVRSAVRRVPPDHRDRYEEEWLAEVAAYSDRPLTAVVRACGVRHGARRTGGELIGRLQVSLYDRATAVVLLISLAPLLVILALLIRLESPGPVLLRQVKQTRDGRTYEFWKFRTIARTTGQDPPLVARTRIGRVLARSDLDLVPFVLAVVWGRAPLNPAGLSWWQILAELFRRREH